MSEATKKVQLNERELAFASGLVAMVLDATKGQQRGTRFEVIASLLANEVYDIAGIQKMGGTQADMEKLTDDMMLWLFERAGEIIAEFALEGAESTAAQ